jgi:hypothetical protein
VFLAHKPKLFWLVRIFDAWHIIAIYIPITAETIKYAHLIPLFTITRTPAFFA